MEIIRTGRLADTFILIAVFIIILVVVYLTGKGWRASVRRLPVIDGLEQAVGRCAEMGRKVFYSSLAGGFDRVEAAQTLASISTMGYVAKLAARLDVPMVVAVMVPETIPLIDDVLRSAYTVEGKPEKYRKEETIRWFSSSLMGFASAVMGTVSREQPQGVIMIGETRADCLMYFEPIAESGCIRIGGTASMSNIHWVGISTDYSAIGEEIFALSAYVSRDPVLTNTLFGEDLVKFGFVGYILIGLLLAMVGSAFFLDLLKI